MSFSFIAMYKLLLTSFLIGCTSLIYAQQDLMVFMKKDKAIAYFRKGTYIVFQLKNKEWYTGFINKIQDDTFNINPLVIHLTMHGADTVHYGLLRVAIKDVYGMPRKGELVNYYSERAHIILGHEHWVWLKNGLILQAGAGGYILLNLLNGLLKKNTVFTATGLGIAASVFLIGELLHLTYKPTLKLGKKYHLRTIKIPS